MAPCDNFPFFSSSSDLREPPATHRRRFFCAPAGGGGHIQRRFVIHAFPLFCAPTQRNFSGGRIAVPAILPHSSMQRAARQPSTRMWHVQF